MLNHELASLIIFLQQGSNVIQLLAIFARGPGLGGKCLSVDSLFIDVEDRTSLREAGLGQPA